MFTAKSSFVRKKSILRCYAWQVAICLIFLKNTVLVSQHSDFLFETLPPRSDIWNSTINAVLQDRKGFLWFGTWSGLWRYDAYSFRQFGAESGLNSSKITCIFEEPNGALWVGTRNTGLYCYDAGREVFLPASEVFPDEDLLHAQNITSVFRDREGRFWIGAEEGLWMYDPVQKRFFEIPIQGITPPPSENIYLYSICQTDDGSIWVAGSHGLYWAPAAASASSRENAPPPAFQQILLQPQGATAREVEYHNFVYTVCPAKNQPHALWIGTKQGLKWLDYAAGFTPAQKPFPGKIEYFEHRDADPNSLSHNFTISICEGNFPSKNAVWVATFNGLNLLDPATGQFRHFFAKEGGMGGLLTNNLRSLIFDRTGILWIGTNHGVNKLDPHFSDFTLHALRHTRHPADEAISFLSQTEQNVWAASFGGGLFRIPIQHNTPLWSEAKQYVLSPDFQSPVTDFISAVLPDGEGRLWCLTQGAGAFRFRESDIPPGGGMICHAEQFTKGSGPVNTGDDYLMSGFIGQNRKVWIGCWDAGINLFDPAQNRILKFTKTSDGKADFHQFPVVTLTETIENGRVYLWAGTRGGGLFKLLFDDKTQLLLLVRHIHREGNGDDRMDGNFIASISVDEYQNFWVTTESGLFVRHNNEQKFKPYNLKSYPKSIHFESILSAGNGHYWVSTSKGIGYFSTNATDSITAIFYENRNGLQELSFQSGSCVRLASGQLYFGGSIGVTGVNPGRLEPDSNAPVPVITGLRLFNHAVLPGIPTEEGFVLEKSLATLTRLELSYRDNVVSFEFSGLHFSYPGQNLFAYKLEGFDPDWLYTNADQRLAHYTNLPPGEYRFLVKAANSDGVWSKQPAQLSVLVRPPWWQSSWAYLLYFAGFVGLLWLVRRLTLIRANYERKIELQHLEKQKLEEVNQMKLIFFTNISHELKTPLTLILTPLEEIIRNRTAENSTLHHTFSMMHRNASRLLTMINQLLDIRKAEEGLMKLEVGEGNVVQFVNEVFLSFRELAKQRQIKFDFQFENPALNVWFDPDQLEKVFFNILSNAFKYTPPKGRILVKIGTAPEKGQYFVRFEDNGTGIPEDKIPFIFERYFRVEEHGETGEEGGTGIGLSLVKNIVERHHGSIEVESQRGQGSVFTVWLPLGENGFSEQEKKRKTVHGEEMAHYTPAPVYDTPVPAVAADPEAETTSPDKPQLLLVEDNPDIRTYLMNNLVAAYQISEAGNGAEGLEKAIELLPDLILCDISMPGMDGLELTRRLKSRVETSHIPIVLLTARTSLIFKIDGLETGADDYVTKPFNMQLLQIRIRNLIESRRRLREKFARSIPHFDNNADDVAFQKMDEDFIKTVMDIIESKLENPDFSVDDLAKILLMNRKQIYRKIKALTDHTPNEFIRIMRLKRAAQLLKTNRYTIAEVTYKVGFQDLKYFRERFKAYFGVNPSDLEGS